MSVSLTKHRALSAIALDIRLNWVKPSPYAKPYIDAMRGLRDINDTYHSDDARWVVLYFLSNAGSWRGEDAKRIKAELKAML